MFSSIAGISSNSLTIPATLQYSSMLEPETFTMVFAFLPLMLGYISLQKYSTPLFCKPTAFIIP